MSEGSGKILREGFSTGTAAAAAAAAACRLLCAPERSEHPIEGQHISISVPLPPIKAPSLANIANSGHKDAEQTKAVYDLVDCKRLTIPLFYEKIESFSEDGSTHDKAVYELTKANGISSLSSVQSAVAAVIKDGGDDPDVTHGACIKARVLPLSMFNDSSALFEILRGKPLHMPGGISLFAGSGIGLVTLPGLPVLVGEPAINPEPRKQIAASVWEQREQNQAWRDIPLAVLLSVENGEHIAEKTLNPRLGIRGGISILGTRGIVRPYSHEAWEEAVRQSLRVGKAAHLRGVALCTGRRSEELARAAFASWSDQAFVQAADYVESSLAEAGRLGFEKVVWVCFWGKLVKLAQGLENTHARSAPLDLAFLADEAGKYSRELAEKIHASNTAVEALAYIQEAGDKVASALINFVGERAFKWARLWLGDKKGTTSLELLCFDAGGQNILHLSTR